jgi:O-methyltransferase involved in polyketide biosynthesis
VTTTRISHSAHYTGTTWLRHGLGDDRLESVLETWRYDLGQLPLRLGRHLNGGVGLDDALLQRHRIIDALLAEELPAAPLVVEVPCGLSARGLRTTAAHPGLPYVEGDLPHMVERKRRALGELAPGHVLRHVDLLAEDGPASLAALSAAVAPERPVVFIMEGMLNYFDRPRVEGIWRRLAAAFSGRPRVRLIADLAHQAHVDGQPLVRTFLALLGVAAQGRMHVHFADDAAVVEALAECGWAEGRVHAASGWADLELPAAGGRDCIGVLDAVLGHSGP